MPVSVNGQVTIPKPVRDLLGITTGTAVEFQVAPDGRVVLARADDAAALQGQDEQHAARGQHLCDRRAAEQWPHHELVQQQAEHGDHRQAGGKGGP